MLAKTKEIMEHEKENQNALQVMVAKKKDAQNYNEKMRKEIAIK